MNIHKNRRNDAVNSADAIPKFSTSRSSLAASTPSTNPNVVGTSFQHQEVRYAGGTETRGGNRAKRRRRNLIALALVVGGLGLAQFRPFFSQDAMISGLSISLSMLLALFGVGILLTACREHFAHAKIANLKRRHPGEGHRWDFPWDKEGASDKSQRVLSTWLIAALIFTFAVPLNLAALASGNVASAQSVLCGFAAGLVDLALIFHIVGSIYKSVRFLRYGSSRIKFAHFPFSLGEKIELTLLEASRLQGCTKIEAKLRCVEERMVIESVGQKLVSHLVPHQLYAETQLLKPLAANQDRIKLSFQTPGDARLNTSLEDDCPRYWELDIRAELPGVDYNSVFLLPIYVRADELIRTQDKA